MTDTMNLTDEYVCRCYAILRYTGRYTGWKYDLVKNEHCYRKQAEAVRGVALASAQLFPRLPVPEICINWKSRKNKPGAEEYFREEKALPIWSPFYLDIDCAEHPEMSLQFCRVAARWFCDELYLPEGDVPVWFSGSKGFHLMVNPLALGITPAVDLTRQYMRPVAVRLHKELLRRGSPATSPDLSAYSLPRLLRLPGEINPKSGLYKIPLTHAELYDLPLDEIRQLAGKPRHIASLVQSNTPVRKASEWWQKQCERIDSDREFRKRSSEFCGFSEELPKQNLTTAHGLPDCIRKLLRLNPPPGMRNRVELQLACWARNAGRSYEYTRKFLTRWSIRNRPEKTPEQSEKKVEGVLKSVWTCGYTFSCAAARSVLSQNKLSPDCQNCQAIKRRNTISALRIGSVQQVSRQPLTREAAHEQLYQLIRKPVQAGNESNSGRSSIKPVRLVCAPPGTGKTHAMIRCLAENGFRGIYAAPTHGLCKEIVQRMHNAGICTHYWRQGPTEEDQCPHGDLVEFYRRFGYHIRRGPCQHCARRKSCTYRKVFTGPENRKADILVMTSWHLRRDDFWQLKATEDRPQLIIDEDAAQAIAAPAVLQFDFLAKFVAGLQAIRDSCSDVMSDCPRSDIGAWLIRRLLEPSEGDEASLALCDILRRASLEIMTLCSRYPKGKWLSAAEYSSWLSSYDLWLLTRDDLFESLLAKAYAAMRKDIEIPNIFSHLRNLLCKSPPVYVSSDMAQWISVSSIPEDREITLLDATAEPSVIEGIINRPVNVLSIPPVKQQAKVYQVMDRLLTRSATRNDVANDEGFIRTFLRNISAKHKRDSILVVTFLEHEEKLKKYMERIHPSSTVVHYGALRGLDLYGDYGAGVIIGRPMPNEAQLSLLAVSSFGMDALSENLLPPELEWTQVNYPLGSTLWQVHCQNYGDPRWQAVWRHVVCGEILQAVGRLRPISNPASVYILTSEPVPPLFQIKGAYAGELFPSMQMINRRRDFQQNVRRYTQAYSAIINEGKQPTNRAICQRLGIKSQNGLIYKELSKNLLNLKTSQNGVNRVLVIL